VRRSIHQHPELSFQEHQTSQLLQNSLLSKGLPASALVSCAFPGFYADITGTGPAAPQSLCIALRAELDALPMQEGNLDLSYRSQIDGVAHTCGHDVHSTMLLGTAWALLAHLDQLSSVHFPAQRGATPERCAGYDRQRLFRRRRRDIRNTQQRSASPPTHMQRRGDDVSVLRIPHTPFRAGRLVPTHT